MTTRIAAGLLLGIGGFELATGLPGLLTFLGALFSGGVPLNTLWGLESLLSFVAGLLISGLQVFFGVALLRKGRGARTGGIMTATADLYLIGYWQVRTALSAMIPAATGSTLVILVVVVLADIGVLALLNGPEARRAFPDPRGSADKRYRARVRAAERIRDGWQSIGRGPDYVIVNIAPAMVLFAPFFWAAAGVFYLVAALPFRPWGGR